MTGSETGSDLLDYNICLKFANLYVLYGDLFVVDNIHISVGKLIINMA